MWLSWYLHWLGVFEVEYQSPPSTPALSLLRQPSIFSLASPVPPHILSEQHWSMITSQLRYRTQPVKCSALTQINITKVASTA